MVTWLTGTDDSPSLWKCSLRLYETAWKPQAGGTKRHSTQQFTFTMAGYTGVLSLYAIMESAHIPTISPFYGQKSFLVITV
jgi:hypothetical protein